MSEKKTPSLTEILQQYEDQLRGGDRLLSATIVALDDFAAFSEKGGLLERRVSIAIIEQSYTRFAAALSEFFKRYDDPLDLIGLEKICFRKPIITNIFAASGYRNMSHLLSLMTSTNSQGKRALSKSKAVLLLAALGVDDVTDELMDLAMKQNPEVYFILMLGWLNERAILTEQGERNRTKLLTSGHLIQSVKIQDKHLAHMLRPWMYCSYASTPNKHDIKQAFNSLFVKRLTEAGLKISPVKYIAKKKPRVLVIHERFNKFHAMFRCYAPWIKTLREDFELIALADSNEIDDGSIPLFDKIIKINAKKVPVSDVVKQVQLLKPDIIYYPSLGMAHWTVLMSNLRLSPIQIMSQGHPATSRSKEIDYVFVYDVEGDLTKVYSEKVLSAKDNDCALFTRHSDLPETLPMRNRIDDGAVHVAINSKIMKLSHRLINICQKLEKESKNPIVFHFFPGERGFYYDGVSAKIKSLLSNARIKPYMKYPDFLQELKNCDLCLAAFPFGNTNGTVDACILGLPTVASFGPECPAQSDLLVLKTADYPLSLVAKDDQKYFEIALNLINNEKARKAISDNISPDLVKKRLFVNDNATVSRSFLSFFKLVAEHHESMNSSGKRVFTTQELDEVAL